MTPDPNELRDFHAALQVSERRQFLRVGSVITVVVLLWSGFDAVLAPELWSVFLALRLIMGAVAAGLLARIG